MTVPAGSPVSVAETAPATLSAASEPAAAVEPSAGVVPYWIVTVLAAPRPFALPLICAEDAVTFVAAPVVTVGGSCTSARTIANGLPSIDEPEVPVGS